MPETGFITKSHTSALANSSAQAVIHNALSERGGETLIASLLPHEVSGCSAPPDPLLNAECGASFCARLRSVVHKVNKFKACTVPYGTAAMAFSPQGGADARAHKTTVHSLCGARACCKQSAFNGFCSCFSCKYFRPPSLTQHTTATCASHALSTWATGSGLPPLDAAAADVACAGPLAFSTHTPPTPPVRSQSAAGG